MTTTAQSVTRNTSSAVGSQVSSDPPGFQPLSASQLSTLSAGGAVIDWPAGHYVYVERVGPFPSVAPAAWAELHAALPAVAAANAVTAYVALYRTDTQTYRACVMTEQEPRALPASLTHEQRAGGRYARFVLDGSYAALPAACGLVAELVELRPIPRREGEFYIEHYVNDPRVTPEDELQTAILVPTP